MLMRKPGPVKAHSFLRLNVPCGSKQNQAILDVGVVEAGLGKFSPGWPALSSITHTVLPSTLRNQWDMLSHCGFAVLDGSGSAAGLHVTCLPLACLSHRPQSPQGGTLL